MTKQTGTDDLEKLEKHTAMNTSLNGKSVSWFNLMMMITILKCETVNILAEFITKKIVFSGNVTT